MNGWVRFGKDETIHFGFGGPQEVAGGEVVDFDIEKVKHWNQRVEPNVGDPIGYFGKDTWASLLTFESKPVRSGVYLGRNLVLTAKVHEA